MTRYINEELRRMVKERADFICEYCLIAAEDVFYRNHVDHIISLKHGGPTKADNLASACFLCNLNKGADLGSIYWPTRQLIQFYNPRIDRWADHFQLSGHRVITRNGSVACVACSAGEEGGGRTSFDKELRGCICRAVNP